MIVDLTSLYDCLDLADATSREITNSELIGKYNSDFQKSSRLYDPCKDVNVIFDPHIGPISMASIELGQVNNINLFGPHELVIFKKYTQWINRSLRSNASAKLKFLDVGANVGLHAIVVARIAKYCSELTIVCVEPLDEPNVARKINAENNNVSIALNLNGAIVPEDYNESRISFIKCQDNLTASTTSISGKEIYGLRSEFPVQAIKPSILFRYSAVSKATDFLIIKVDIEGAEAYFLEDLLPLLKTNTQYHSVAIVVEVSSKKNAAKILELIKEHQKDFIAYSDIIADGKRVSSLSDIPFNWSQGSLYIEKVQYNT